MTLRAVINDLPARTRVVVFGVAGVAVVLTAAQVLAPWWPGWPEPAGARPTAEAPAYAWPSHTAWALARLAIVAAGLLAWLRWRSAVRWRAGLAPGEPFSRDAGPQRSGSTAVLLVAWSLIALSAGLGAGHNGVLLVWGYLASGALVPAVFAHAVLTYPDGRPAGRWQRLFLTFAYGSVLLFVAYALTAEPDWITTCAPAACPDNPLLVHSSLGWSWFAWWAQKLAAFVLVAWLGFLLLGRLRTDPPARRRALIAALAAAAVPAVAFAWRLLLDAAYPADNAMWGALRWFDVLADLAVPAAMLVGLWVSDREGSGITWSTPVQRTSAKETAMTSSDPRPLSATPIAPAVGDYLDDEAPEPTPDPREVRHTVPPVDENGNVIEDPATADAAADDR